MNKFDNAMDEIMVQNKIIDGITNKNDNTQDIGVIS